MYFRKLTPILTSKEKKRLFWIFILLLISAVFESAGIALIIPYLYILQNPKSLSEWFSISSLLDLLSFQNTETTIILLTTFAFFLFILIRMTLQTYIHYVLSKFPYEIFRNHSRDLLDCYLTLDYRQYLNLNSSILLKNITITIDAVACALFVYLQYIAALLIVLALAIVIMRESLMISIPLISLFTGIACLLYVVFKERQRSAGEEREVFSGALNKQATEILHSAKEIRLYSKTSFFLNQYSETAAKLAQANARISFYPLLPPLYIESAAILLVLALVMMFTFQSLPLANLVPYLIFYGIVGRRLLPAINSCISQRIILKRLEPSVDLLQKELNQKSIDKRDKETKRDPLKSQFETACSLPEMNFRNLIEFRDVSFAYEKTIKVLKNVNLTIKRGESIAFVGPSGAGKSTLINLLIGLLKPSEGALFVDNCHVNCLSGLGSQIGYVPQSVILFDDTLENNIIFGDQIVNRPQLEEAIEIAQLSSLINDLPNGLKTRIGEKGTLLSGGQCQRIGIARALYRNPQLIIFDEATASLDGRTEHLFTQKVREKTKGKTILAVTHRLNTIRNFDRICLLHEGELIASGSHEELAKNCHLYQVLVAHAQDRAEEASTGS